MYQKYSVAAAEGQSETKQADLRAFCSWHHGQWDVYCALATKWKHLD